MFAAARDVAAVLSASTEPLAWTVVGLFVTTALLDRVDRPRARRLGAAAWAVFAAFWLLLVPHFALAMRSFVEGALGSVAVGLCLLAGYRLWTGDDRLFAASRAVGFAGLCYLPFTIDPLRGALVEAVAAQTHALVGLVGYDAALAVHDATGYRSELVFTTGGERFATFLVLACTGIGSVAVFAGAIAATAAPLGRKLRALVLAVGAIYVLNLARNVFIAVAFGKQYLQVAVPAVLGVTGYDQPGLVSYFLADRVVSQSLSVVVLVGLALAVARVLPELLDLVEASLSALAGREVRLAPGPTDATPAAESPTATAQSPTDDD